MDVRRPWENKVAVITGGASGIGEATVAEFVGVELGSPFSIAPYPKPRPVAPCA